MTNDFDSIPEPQRLALFALNHDLSRGIPEGDPLARCVATHDACYANQVAHWRIRLYVLAENEWNGEAGVRFQRAKDLDVCRAAHPQL